MTSLTVPSHRKPTTAIDLDSTEIIAAIKQTVCKGASDAQLQVFIQVCRSTGLNPWLKEIYFVAEKGLIMASRDGYLRIANEHPMFDGMETRIERDAKNVPVKATCSVWRKDRSHAITCEAYYSEYRKPGQVWQQYPSAMIGKVAEVLALKRSFAIDGCVSEEEMGTEHRPSNVEPIRRPPQAAAAIAERVPEEHEAEVTYEEIPLPEEERSEIERELAQSLEMAETRKRMLEGYRIMRQRYAAIDALKTFAGFLGMHGVKRPEDFPSTPEGAAAALECFTEMRRDVAWREESRR